MALRNTRRAGKILVGLGVGGGLTALLIFFARKASAAESDAGKYRAAADAAGKRASAAAASAQAAAGRERAALAQADANARAASVNAQLANQARAQAIAAGNALALAQQQLANAKNASQAAAAREAVAKASAAAALATAQANARDAAAAQQRADAEKARSDAAIAAMQKQQAAAEAQRHVNEATTATNTAQVIDQKAAAEIQTDVQRMPPPPPPQFTPPPPPPRITALPPPPPPPPRLSPHPPSPIPGARSRKDAVKKSATVTTIIPPASLKLVNDAYVKAVKYAIDEYKKWKNRVLTPRQALAIILTPFREGSRLMPDAAAVPDPDHLAEPSAYWANDIRVVNSSMLLALQRARGEVDYQTGNYKPISGFFGEPAFWLC